MKPAFGNPPPPTSPWSSLLSLGLTVAGLRWMVFAYAGSPLPYFDQWLAEFNNLFLLGASGPAPASILLQPHNEHLPVTMKLVSVLGFLLNSYWDVKFLAVASGLVRAACAGVTWALLAPGSNRASPKWLWLLCAAFFGLPWSAFNALNGMQVSFYFVDLALLLSLLVMQRWSGISSAIALVGLMIFGLGSMASALAIPLATLAWHQMQPRPRAGFAVAWTLTMLAGLAYVSWSTGSGSAFTPTPLESIHFSLQLMAWPLASPVWGLAVLTGGLLLWIWRQKIPPAHLIPGAFALGVFALGNAAMLALHRTAADFHPRHWDTLGWLPFGLVIVLYNLSAAIRPSRVWRWAGVGIIAVIAAVYLGRLYRTSWPDLQSAHQQRNEIVRHYRQALLSGTFRAESDQLNAQLMARDYSFFDDPIGRFAIPPLVAANIAATPLPALALLSPDILPVRPPSLTTRITRVLLLISPCVVLAGVMLFAWRILRAPSDPNPMYHVTD